MYAYVYTIYIYIYVVFSFNAHMGPNLENGSSGASNSGNDTTALTWCHLIPHRQHEKLRSNFLVYKRYLEIGWSGRESSPMWSLHTPDLTFRWTYRKMHGWCEHAYVMQRFLGWWGKLGGNLARGKRRSHMPISSTANHSPFAPIQLE